ncbi:hypothetical protein L7F22_054257 [Adiantum nelumboides]|nr:hypothetical protein [Adiantum nelumboides]
MAGMHRVGSANNVANSTRPRKEHRLTYVLCDSQEPKHCSGINCLTVKSPPSSHGGSSVFVFSGSRDGTVKRWESRDEATIRTGTFESHIDWVNDVVLSGKTLVSCSSDTTIKTWGAFSDEGHCIKTFRYVISLAAAKHSNLIASAGLGGEVFVWDLDAANAMAMNDTATILVSGGTEKAVRVWDPRSGAKTMKLKGHADNIRALLLDPSGRFCLSGSSDSMIRLWDLGQQRCVHSYAVHTDSVWALATTPSPTFIVVGVIFL